jgi:hypothetical protein
MAMIQTHTSERIYVIVVNATKMIRLRIGPSEHGTARVSELTPSEARKIALFLLTGAEKMADSA